LFACGIAVALLFETAGIIIYSIAGICIYLYLLAFGVSVAFWV